MTSPTEITPENTERYLGKDAQRNNILAARVLAETVKTTLGPKGMDKMLVDHTGSIIVTNDGVTILDEMEIEHPAARMIVDIAKTQEQEVGDGTTTAVMLAGKLLENAEKLLDKKIHPTIITRGYKYAATKSTELLKELAIEISTEDELAKIAQTAMTGKGAEFIKEKLDNLIVEAVKLVSVEGKVDLEDIKLEKQKGDSVEQTELIKGIVIDKGKVSSQMPTQVANAKIALIDCSLEVRKLDTEASISISSPEQFQGFINQEEEILKSLVFSIEQSGANVVICQKGIDEVAQFYLAKKGIYAIRRVPKTDLQKISKAVNGNIVSNIKDLNSNDLGSASLIQEKKHAEEDFTYITGCQNPKAVTILIKGGTEHVLDEIERAVKDALGDVAAVLKDSMVVSGGGAIEIELAKKLREYSQTLKGREQLAVEEFASALEFIPTTLAENAGLDPIDILTELKVTHETGNPNFGLNLFSGKIEDTLMQGIIEPLKVKTQAISSASEVATMILRIDDIISAGKLKKGKGGMGDYD